MSDETQVIEDAQDYLIKCNSCGRVQRKSDPAQCQCRGSGSWSYEGPLPVEEVNAAEWYARMGGPGPAGSDDYPEPASDDPPMGVMIDGVPHTVHPYVQEGDQTDDDAAIDAILDAEEDEVEGTIPPSEYTPLHDDGTTMTKDEIAQMIEEDVEKHFAEIDAHEAIVKGTFASLLSLGHTEAQAREMISKALFTGRIFSSVTEMIDAIYNPTAEPEVGPSGDEDEDEDEDDEDEDPFANRTTGFEWALDQIIKVNQEAMEQKAKVKEAQARLKEEKEQLEGIQDNLNRLIQEAAKLKSADTPDPVKYPLLDGQKEAKQLVNGMFAKPEAIPPLPPDTQDEFMRIKRRDTRLDAIGISNRVTTALAKADYHTVADIGKLTEASAPLTSVKGVGEAAAGEIMERLGDVAQQWVTEWQQTHPE